MNEDDTKAAMGILKKINEHSIMKSFKSIPRSEDATIDLTEIETNLQKNHYKSIKDVFIDIDKILSEFYKRKNDDYGFMITEECRRIINKLRYGLYKYLDISEWLNIVYKTEMKLTLIMTNVPQSDMLKFKMLGSARINRGSSYKVSEKDKLNLIAALEKINNEEDHKHLIEIVTKKQSDLNANEDVININDLKIKTVESLTNYMRACLEREGLSFP